MQTESIDMILDYAEAKNAEKSTNCMLWVAFLERYQNDLENLMPEVDRYFGKFDMKAMVDELKVTFHPEYIYERKITTPVTFCLSKSFSEGCNRSCSFCAIPMMIDVQITHNWKSDYRSALSCKKRGKGNITDRTGTFILRNRYLRKKAASLN